MKIKVLEYHRYKNGIVRVKSHSLKKGKWVINPRFDFHKFLVTIVWEYPILTKKFYEVEK
jgi:hypothetical protein